MALVESVVQAINENPSLVLRAMREGLKVALQDKVFRQELIDLISTSVDHKLVEPLYDRALAIRLVPCSIDQFNRITKKLSHVLKPPYYRLVGDAHRRHRLFYASDIEEIRKALHCPFKESTKLRFKDSNTRASSVGQRGTLALTTLH